MSPSGMMMMMMMMMICGLRHLIVMAAINDGDDGDGT